MSFFIRLFAAVYGVALAVLSAAWIGWSARAGFSGGALLGFLALAGLAAGLSWFVAKRLSKGLAADLGRMAEALGQFSRGNFEDPGVPEGSGALPRAADLFRDAAAAARTRIATLEERYLQEKTQLETLVYNMTDGIVIMGLRGEVFYMNAPGMRMLGVKPEDARGAAQGFFELAHREQMRASVQKILERHSHSEIVEVPPSEGEGGTTRFYHTTVTLFTAPGVNTESGVLLTMRDVTVERQLTQLKEEFFHAVAHDLRAPIFAVQGYLRLLEKATTPDAKLKGYFTAIYQSCEKLTLFIQDILDTHRLESGQLNLNVTALEPLTFVQRIKDIFSPVAEEKGVKLETRFPEDYPGSIEADDRLLERVFNNLVTNALRYTSRGGTVRISAARAGESDVRFSVSDTGPGIPPDKLATVFDKFQQLDAKSTRTGFGLGLNICRRIVELHGGKIWVESPSGKGSEFVFRIPIRQT